MSAQAGAMRRQIAGRAPGLRAELLLQDAAASPVAVAMDAVAGRLAAAG